MPLVSADGSTIIQYGDLTFLDEPQRLDVYWIAKDGKVKNRLINYYGGEATVNLSADGYTAVGGPVIAQDQRPSISLFSPEGEKAWETSLEQGRRIAQLYPARQGSSVVAVSTDAEDWLEGHQLDIYGQSGNRQSVVRGLGIVQRAVLLGDETRLFFQGADSHGMIETGSGEVIWKKAGKVTMVSPHGAALSPDGKYLFLVVIQPEAGRRKSPYTWKLLILNPSTGNEINSLVLPEKYPATWDPVFDAVSNTGLSLRTGESIVVFTIEN
ncbi:MAG: hypothetical protein J5I94_27065 [Phaeodactylibacter sp.]|nr:hypothetical protein [Phaeodactylibacter sp.]